MKRKRSSKRMTKSVVAYLRVSTDRQDFDNQRLGILDYFKARGIEGYRFVEEKVSGKEKVRDRKLGEVAESLCEGDLLVVSELSRLGRDTCDVLNTLSLLLDKGVAVHSVKEGHDLNAGIESKILSLVMCMAAEISRDLTSRRIKEAIARRKLSGKPVGRPVGSTTEGKLAPYKSDIAALRRSGMSKASIARHYSVSWPTVDSFCRRNGLEGGSING